MRDAEEGEDGGTEACAGQWRHVGLGVDECMVDLGKVVQGLDSRFQFTGQLVVGYEVQDLEAHWKKCNQSINTAIKHALFCPDMLFISLEGSQIQPHHLAIYNVVIIYFILTWQLLFQHTSMLNV